MYYIMLSYGYIMYYFFIVKKMITQYIASDVCGLFYLLLV